VLRVHLVHKEILVLKVPKALKALPVFKVLKV
jgi:hypothetical protein